MEAPSPTAGAREIDEAAQILRDGGLVAFPTETVYGLGADAERPAAVARIFAAKGRPADHPLIVHFADPAALGRWTVQVPASAALLAARFWPGPLTLVLARGEALAAEVSGGRPTVGLRVPAHPVALALLRAFGGGLAAPSANRFGAVSPTTAEHVRADLGDRVDRVLDGGPCAVGVESTIVDLSRDAPMILRPGGVPVEAIEEALGRPVAVQATGVVAAPGALPSHYAPAARVELVAPGEFGVRATELRAAGLRVGVIAGAGGDDGALAQSLYARLRELDQQGCDVILATVPAERGLGAAIADRLRKAAGPRPGR
jgi:L-threonylcarbamoyladenylate synthase